MEARHIVNFFTFLASEVREIMAELGFKNFNDMIGQRGYLDFDEANKHWKANNLDLSNLLPKLMLIVIIQFITRKSKT